MAALRVKPTPVPRVVVAVAEHHRLHVHRGAEVVADALAHAVGDGAGAVPAPEHRLDGAAQLHRRVLRERLAGVASRRRPCSCSHSSRERRRRGRSASSVTPSRSLAVVEQARRSGSPSRSSTMRPYIEMKRR